MPTNVILNLRSSFSFPRQTSLFFPPKFFSKNQTGHNPRMATTEETSNRGIQLHSSPPHPNPHLTA